MLYTYGGTSADVLTDQAGNVVPDYLLRIYRAGTDEIVTALFEEDGLTPIAELRSNPAGSDQPGAIRPFKLSDVTAIEYAYNGTTSEVRWYQAARELAQQAVSQAAGALSRSEGGTVSGHVSLTGGAAVSGLQVTDGAAIDELSVGKLVVGDGILAGSASINVHSYGAQGDGVADDAPAVQEALNAATPGGEVLVPPGTYRLATLPLRIYRGTHLRLMEGAKFVRAADATLITNGDADQNYPGYTGHGDLTIEGGVWDMRGAAVGLTASRMCISLGHATRVTIRDVEIRDVSGYHAIEINACKDVRIIDCSFKGFRDPGGREFSEAIQPDLAKGSAYFGAFGPYDHTACEDLLISGCYFGPSGTPGTTSWPRGIGSHSATITKWHKRVRVLGNTFEGCAQYAMTAYNYQDVVFANNNVTGCGGGFRAQPPVLSDPNDTKLPDGTQTGASQAVRNFTVTGNTFRDLTGHDEAVTLDGVDTGKVLDVTIAGNVIDGIGGAENGVRLIHAQQVSVTGNVVRGAANTGISQDNVDGCVVSGNRVYASGGSGITADTCTGMLITGNTVRDAGVNGIHVLAGSDIQVLDNMVKSASRGSSGNYGIRVSTGTDGITIAGNSVRLNGSGNEIAYGLSITNTCTNVRRWGNELDGTSGPLQDGTTGPVTTPFQSGHGGVEDAISPASRYETTSRLRCSTSGTITSGQLTLVPIWLPKGVTITAIGFVSGGTAAASPTNQWFALFNRDRVAVARTVDATTASWAANTVKQLNVAQTTAGSTTSYRTTYEGLYFLGVLVAAATPPSLLGEGNVHAALASVAPSFGGANTGLTSPPTVTSGAYTATAPSGTGLLAYGYVVTA
ncbi:right-handed parallel beta-helix repeat-containing protein [Streptomyces sp. CO7]